MTKQFRLLRYVWPHWRQLVAILITMALSIALNVARPWPTKLLVDSVLGHKSLPGAFAAFFHVLPGRHDADGLLLWVCLSTVLIFLIGTVIGTLSNVISTAFGQRMTYDISADLFAYLQRLSLLFHSRRPVGDTIARVTGDAYCLETLVKSALLPLLQSILTLVTMFLIMWQLSASLTLLSLGVVPFLVLTIRFLGSPMKRTTRVRRDLEGKMSSLVEQTLTAIPAVQAFTREELEVRAFRHYAGATVRAYVRSIWASSWFSLAAGLATAAGTAGIMYVGGLYTLHGTVTVGTLLVFISYLGSLYGPLNDITYTASTLQVAAAQSDRVLEILEAPLDVQDRADAREIRLDGEVRLDRVTFGYTPDRETLKDVSLEARPGEVVAIVGPTGAGKTTLVNLLIRFFDPWRGSITIGGTDIRTIKLRCLREQIAMVLQEPFLFPMSVADNIAYGRPDATREEIVAAAVAANADSFIRRLPDGYDSVIGERGATLSGGEKQRLSIARAFLKDAPILILDEPTSALDARTEARLLDALERLMHGRTTFIIAHRLSTIRGADRILVVDGGRIVEEGGHYELVARGGMYAGLYTQQMDITRHDAVSPAPESCAEVVG